ncbi:MAG TPA: hypothetical protein VLX31_03930 [Streptosporangiaceae bacterium]|nr:hypothetical protein [Streptosporangiaceae bacterium]
MSTDAATPPRFWEPGLSFRVATGGAGIGRTGTDSAGDGADKNGAAGDGAGGDGAGGDGVGGDAARGDGAAWDDAAEAEEGGFDDDADETAESDADVVDGIVVAAPPVPLAAAPLATPAAALLVTPAAARRAAAPPAPPAAFAPRRAEWSEIKAMFVDDPRGSVELASGLVGAAIDDLTQAVRRHQAELASFGTEGDDGQQTEQLRKALLAYRRFADELECLAANLPVAPATGS